METIEKIFKIGEENQYENNFDLRLIIRFLTYTIYVALKICKESKEFM